MSGGKKKPPRTQGWEEAGSEFYQESYPTDAELDAAIQRGPNHLATLLPSKQTRAVAATIHIRTNNKTMRRQTSLRSRRESTVHRRTSVVGDTQVSMPDLSSLISTEQTTWEAIMQIKAMPLPMSEKKLEKAKILQEPNLRLKGYEQFKWKRRKMWRRFQSRLKETYQKLSLWRGALKHIEGNFGTGVVAYFIFLKYLLFLNLSIFSLVFIFITLPYILLEQEAPGGNTTANSTEEVANATTNTHFTVLDLIQGTGFMESTFLFYGYYPWNTLTYWVSGAEMYYNLPLAYIGATLTYFLVSLIVIVKSAARGLRERLFEGEGQFYQYCNLIFGGWDFCIHNEKSAAMKHKAILNEIRGCLEAEKLVDMRQNRTRNELVKLILVRTIINVVVLSVLVAAGYAIFTVFQLSDDNKKNTVDNSWEELLYEFLPSLTIVCLNILVPFVFKMLIKFENYTPSFVVKLTLFRTVLLRLASVFTLYASLYNEIQKQSQPCWETYVGQQIYKLVLTDFATHVILTFGVNLPRALLARHLKNRCCTFVGEQSFDLPKHVLDVVYSQTLCWFGCFYAPLLSVAFSVLFFFMFYIKKFACLVNSNPSSTIYRASKSNSLFMTVLLVAFVSAIIPIAYSLSELKPSLYCGPFRGKESVWGVVIDTFMQTPTWVRSAIFFLSTAGFAVPLIIILFLLFYYYRAINSANRHMVEVLKNQLVLEGHDKQFLMERLTKFLKQQQENQKRLRQAHDVMADGDTN